MSKLLLLRPVLMFLLCAGIAASHSPKVLAIPPQGITPFVTSCATDREIPENDLTAADAAAMQFIQKVVGTNPAAAYSSLTEEAKKNVDAEAFAAWAKANQQMGPYTKLRVVHTYVPRLTGGAQEQRVVCGDLSSPQGWVAVAAKPGVEQAHVIIEGQTRNNTWAFVTWLIRDKANWQVQYFRPTAAAMVGKSAQDLWEMARREEEHHHDFNACALYATALQLAGRGPNFQLGIEQKIQEEMAHLQVPKEIQGQPPFVWRFDKSEFKILNVGPLGVGGKIYLNIEQEIAHWTNDKDADDANRRLIALFKKAYPEYGDVFAGFVVAAREAGGTHGYRTIDEEPPHPN